jgi:hypothetical protein
MRPNPKGFSAGSVSLAFQSSAKSTGVAAGAEIYADANFTARSWNSRFRKREAETLGPGLVGVWFKCGGDQREILINGRPYTSSLCRAVAPCMKTNCFPAYLFRHRALVLCYQLPWQIGSVLPMWHARSDDSFGSECRFPNDPTCGGPIGFDLYKCPTTVGHSKRSFL